MHDMKTLSRQHGGTFLGFILGLVIGLAVALGVAMYVTKVPTPFSSKNQTRTPEQDVVETQKNRDWNPNGVLQPKAPASTPVDAHTTTPATTPATAPTTAPATAPVAEGARKDTRPAVVADPLGELARAKAAGATEGAAEPFQYMVQVGAYRSLTEADGQKARMALMGLDAKVSEREQAGRTVYRVRLGPYDDKAQAERVRARLETAQIESAIVRMQR